MALNTSPKIENPVAAAIQLELAIYQRYSRLGVLYTKTMESGHPRVYTFTLKQAAILLQEVDDIDARPIWRRPRVVRTRSEIEVDRTIPVNTNATQDVISPMEEDDTSHLGLTARIDDGRDADIQDIIDAAAALEDLPADQVTVV